MERRRSAGEALRILGGDRSRQPRELSIELSEFGRHRFTSRGDAWLRGIELVQCQPSRVPQYGGIQQVLQAIEDGRVDSR